MDKIKCDTNQVNSNVINYLRQTIDYLNSALNEINNSSGPSGYNSVNKFYALKQDIINLKTRINNLISWLEQSTNRIDNDNTTICNTLNNISVSIITKISSIVNPH